MCLCSVAAPAFWVERAGPVVNRWPTWTSSVRALKEVLFLGVRYSTSCSAISANRLARRSPAETRGGRLEAAPPCFVDEGGVLLSDLR